jgi:hypothetical protein
LEKKVLFFLIFTKVNSSASFTKRKSIGQIVGDIFKNEPNQEVESDETGQSSESVIYDSEQIQSMETQRKILRRGTITPISSESRVLKEGVLKKLGKRYWS